jgi:hypothetical protein
LSSSLSCSASSSASGSGSSRATVGPNLSLLCFSCQTFAFYSSEFALLAPSARPANRTWSIPGPRRDFLAPGFTAATRAQGPIRRGRGESSEATRAG